MIKIDHDHSPGNRLAIGRDMFVFRSFEALITQDDWTNWSDERASQVGLDIGWNAGAYSYEILDLHVIASSGVEAVTGTLLRALPIQLLLRRCVNRALYWQDEIGRFQSINSLIQAEPELLSDLAANGPKPETLEWVARMYMLGKIKLDPPTKWVAESFGIPHRTASHWVKLARERGHLDL